MKKFGMLFAAVLMACGGSSGGGAQEPSPASEQNESLPEPDTAAYETPPEEPAEEPAPEPEEPVAPEPPPPPPPVVAFAELKAVKDDAPMGTITFERGEDGKITITGEFTGLKKKAVLALYVHETGDCSGKGKKIGGHLNPTKAKHGPPESSSRHAGDFGNITADDTGAATFSMITDSVTVEADRPDSVLNRSVVIHAKKDGKKDSSAGAALACGVIQLKE